MDNTSKDNNTISDNDLISNMREKDDQISFAILMERYKVRIKSLSYQLLFNSDMAEDAAQDVFCTVWKNRDKWDINGTASFSTWIYRVTVNRCVDIKRKMRPQIDIADMELSNDEDIEGDLAKNMRIDSMTKLLDILPDNQALALRLYYLEDKNISDICSQMSKTELSIRSMIKRGKSTLRANKDLIL
jgi:RNA polymerase sigma-70 factor (ECF subfamily)